MAKCFHVKWRVTVGFAVVFLVLLAAPLVALRNLAKLRAEGAWVSHTREALLKIAAIDCALRDAEATQRGYLLTGGSEYQRAYAERLGPIHEQLEALKAFTADNARQQEHLAALRGAIEARLATLAANARLRESAGAAAAGAAVGSGEGLRQGEEVRRLIGAISDEETGLLRQRVAVAQRQAQQTLWMFVAPAFLACLSVGALWLMVNQNVKEKSEEADRREAARDAILAKTTLLSGRIRETGRTLTQITDEAQRLIEQIELVAQGLIDRR